ncbi:hypothetical protein PTKIN_Ptkin03bG0193600 [Pterospermum kingtungense]
MQSIILLPPKTFNHFKIAPIKGISEPPFFLLCHRIQNFSEVKEIMASSPSHSDTQSLAPAAEAEYHLSSLVYDMSQQVQMAMENMLKMIAEIDQNSLGIEEEIEKCKYSALERKESLEKEKERFQKAAYTVLDMLNNRD